jgi:hypothetical protein
MEHTLPDQPGPWRVLGASVAGSGHRQHGQECADAHLSRQLADGSLILAVADGAGSASHGAQGAQSAVRAASDTLETEVASQGPPGSQEQALQMLRGALQAARLALEELAGGTEDRGPGEQRTAAPPLPLRAFATTLLLVLASGPYLALAQIGDGCVVSQDDAGQLQALTVPRHGEYLNETHFVTEPDYLELAQLHVCPLVSEQIAVLTDGLEMLALDFPTHVPYAPFFLPLFKFAARAEASEEALQAFLTSERVCARTDDDKTLILAVRQCIDH